MTQATTVRLLPPNGAAKSIVLNGRTITCAAGGTVDVPFADASVLSANGWIQVAGSGTTAQRPVNPFNNQFYHDTTLNLTLVWEGAAWRNPASGASV